MRYPRKKKKAYKKALEKRGAGWCEFNFPVDFKNGYMARVRLPLGRRVMVQVTDIVSDNYPKVSYMTLGKFHKTFTVTTVEYDGGITRTLSVKSKKIKIEPVRYKI